MPPQSLKIDHARYVLTLDRQRRIIQDGAVLVENGRISRVGKAAELAEAVARTSSFLEIGRASCRERV